ncbi:hypothetical protein P692DRAFT_201851407 [Suillus brevipes Sb2]|nr:hypothetical protein P692DRAFT_201851407 [Suillus brevipes Sb2]
MFDGKSSLKNVRHSVAHDHVAYGKTTPTSATDPDAILVRENFQILRKTMRPGAYLVDMIPWLKYLPWYAQDLKRGFERNRQLNTDQLNRVKQQIVVAIAGVLILGIVLDVGGGPSRDRIGSMEMAFVARLSDIIGWRYARCSWQPHVFPKSKLKSRPSWRGRRKASRNGSSNDQGSGLVNTSSCMVLIWLCLHGCHFSGLLAWFCIGVTYMLFHQGLQALGYDRPRLPYASRLQPYASWWVIASSLVTLLRMASLFEANWSTATFVTTYLPIMLFPVLYLSAKFLMRVPLVKPSEMDFKSGTEDIDAERSKEPSPKNWSQAVRMSLRYWSWVRYFDLETMRHFIFCTYR